VHINDLADETLQRIFSHLNLATLERAKQVSLRWEDLVTRASTLHGRDDWQLVGSARVAEDGVLHLTELVMQSRGGVICKAIIEAKDEIRLSFQIYAGEGRQSYCADGISFFVLDGSKHDGYSIGHPGGCLGYVRIPHAVLGVGFDEWGNFTRACEGHDGAEENKNLQWTVCIRGSGNIFQGYNYITHKKVPEWYNVWTNVTIVLRIDRSQQGTLSMEMENEKIQKIQVFENVALNQKLPPQLAFGFAASTGDLVNKHYVRNVHVQFSFYGEKIDTTVGNHSTFHQPKPTKKVKRPR